jgi:chemotaxis receptor (MCP) glutamine deamidase CheD
MSSSAEKERLKAVEERLNLLLDDSRDMHVRFTELMVYTTAIHDVFAGEIIALTGTNKDAIEAKLNAAIASIKQRTYYLLGDKNPEIAEEFRKQFGLKDPQEDAGEIGGGNEQDRPPSS